MTHRSIPLAVAFCALAVPAAHAASEVTPLSDFSVSEFKNGWTADTLLDSTVSGEDGSQVGEVANIVINEQGMVERLVVETDNWLDVGDRMISVPWDNVQMTPADDGIRTQIDEDHMDDFSLFAEADVDTDAQTFRASDLIGDYVLLKDATHYGYVTDVVFNESGELKSVIVSPDVLFGPDDYAGGYYAYPFYGYDHGFEPFSDVYELPYETADVEDYEPIEGDMFDEEI